MRIVFILPRTGIGGAERQALYLLKELKGHASTALDLVCFSPGEWHENFKQLNIGVHIVPRRTKLWADLPRLLQLRSLLHALEPDIVQGWLIEGNVLGWLATPKNASFVASERATASSENMALHNFADGTAQRSARLVIANSEQGRRWAIRKGVLPERIAVVPNAVRLSVNRRSDVDSTIGYLGRLSPQKGLGILAMAAARLPRHVRVLVAGPSQYFALADVPGHERLEYVGLAADVPAFLSKLSLLVLPSVNGEGLSNVLLEACASKTPFVTTDVGDNGAFARDVEMPVVPPGSVSALANAIQDCLENPPLYPARRELILEERQPSIVASKLLASYRQVRPISP